MRRGDGHELGIDVGDGNGRPCGPAHRRVEQNTVVRVPQVPAGASQVTFPKHMLTLMAGSGRLGSGIGVVRTGSGSK